MLKPHPALMVVWLSSSVWLSFWQLSRWIAERPTLSLRLLLYPLYPPYRFIVRMPTTPLTSPLPLHNSVGIAHGTHEDIGQEASPHSAYEGVQVVILVVFSHAWMSMIHLLTGRLQCNSETPFTHFWNPVIARSITFHEGLSGVVTLPSWSIVVLATLLIVIGFGKYLMNSGITPDHWGYFYILHCIVCFVFSWVYVILWAIDLCEGQLEIKRRRRE